MKVIEVDVYRKVSVFDTIKEEVVPHYVDVRKIVGVEKLEADKLNEAKTFKVYFDNAIWQVCASCYQRLLDAWLSDNILVEQFYKQK